MSSELPTCLIDNTVAEEGSLISLTTNSGVNIILTLKHINNTWLLQKTDKRGRVVYNIPFYEFAKTSYIRFSKVG